MKKRRTEKPQLLIYTDLDGTFLDHETYSCAPLELTLSELEKRHIPIIFCSSKTRREILDLCRRTGVTHPFVCENGSAICIPDNYFDRPFEYSRRCDGYSIIEMGLRYPVILSRFNRLKELSDLPLRGYSDMTIEEIAAETGLNLSDVTLAKQREYSEPFTIPGNDPLGIEKVCAQIRGLGLSFTRGGRFFHLMGASDKGQAARRLNTIYQVQCHRIRTIGLGDSPNDLPMLKVVDEPVLVKKPDGSHDQRVIAKIPGIKKTEGIGPHGWREAIERVLKSARPGTEPPHAQTRN